ncbi:hypothetical protein [Actinomadura kijaniata]|nr:hypothetical protein [Actinomadura kijaniata]
MNPQLPSSDKLPALLTVAAHVLEQAGEVPPLAAGHAHPQFDATR